jgi:hypothetical protein
MGRHRADRGQLLARARRNVAIDCEARAGGEFRHGASAQNPVGYQPMMLFFFVLGAPGFVFAMLLWGKAGRRHHEAVTHAQ